MDENKDINKEEKKEEKKVEILVKEKEDGEFEIENLDNANITDEEKDQIKKMLEKNITKLKKITAPSKYDKFIQNIVMTLFDFLTNILTFTLFSFLIPWFDQKYSFSLEKLITFLVLSLVYCLLMKIVMTIISNYLLDFWAKYSVFLRIPLEAIMLCLAFLITSISVSNILLLLLTFILFTFVATIIKFQFRRLYLLRKLKIFK